MDLKNSDPSNEIRPAVPADARALVPLFEQLGYPTERTEIRSRLESKSGDWEVLVARHEGGISGFVAVEIQHDFIAAKRGLILGLVVADGWRGGGIGAALLAAAEAWAFERGAPLVVVRSNVIRARAHRFYEREGYRRVKTQHVFEKRGGF
jgi:GNAT superfamily N-acetyltransferase